MTLNIETGPVGLLAAYSAIIRGAIRVYVVDHVPERLARAKSIGAIPINFSHGDPVKQILKLEPNGVDRSCDLCGFECIDAEGNNVENLIITQMIAVTRNGGGIGLTGVYTSKDLGPSCIFPFFSGPRKLTSHRRIHQSRSKRHPPVPSRRFLHQRPNNPRRHYHPRSLQTHPTTPEETN
jgi:threonine dehydrogenase-like Zn-dependent dehydrogenase